MELARVQPGRKCCELAEIAGFLRVAGSVSLAGRGQFRIICQTDNPAAARHYRTLIQDYFRVEAGITVTEKTPFGKGRLYNLTVGPEMNSEAILRETGILMIREGNNYISDGIYEGLLRKKCCRRACLRGLFLGAGTVTNPEKSYDLEFVLNSEVLAHDIRRLIHTFDDLSASVAVRDGRYVVYLKSAQNVSDMLALMGAHRQMLKLEDILIKKQVLNQTVRETNCDTANTDRLIDASEKQVRAIRALKESGRWESLSVKLRELGELRLEHPYASIAELGEFLDPPLGKSGVNGRLKRIMDAAAAAEKNSPGQT